MKKVGWVEKNLLKPMLALVLVMTAGFVAKAAPVINLNSANSGIIIIYPDHADADRFYIAPNVVKVAKDSKGRPQFSYSSYKTSLFGHNALLQIVLEPQYTQEDLLAAEKEILAKNPKAQFSGVPVISANVAFDTHDKDLILENGCDHKAGLVGQQIACSLHLSGRGDDVFKKLINSGQLVSTMNYVYRVSGMMQKPDKSYDAEVGEWGVAVVIEGAGLPHVK